MSSPDVDWTEFQNDIESREFIQTTIARLESMAQSLKNNKILHDYDCYQVALIDYDYTKYKAGTKATGYEVKANELSQFFAKNTNAKKAANPVSLNLKTINKNHPRVNFRRFFYYRLLKNLSVAVKNISFGVLRCSVWVRKYSFGVAYPKRIGSEP